MLIIRAHGDTPEAKTLAEKLYRFICTELKPTEEWGFAVGSAEAFKDKIKVLGEEREMERYIEFFVSSPQEMGPHEPADPPKGWRPKREKGETK